ncbi:MAG: type III-A CRISPR-associated protein Cas10/Csm1 [Bacteroidaceae bacterium]|nr:type III-A CRISPR-associated protein Cas10/Csm1 [Bacteroidaceae bacterium]
MEKDLLYQAAIVHTVAKLWPEFKDVAAHTQPPNGELCSALITRAQSIAAGTATYTVMEAHSTTPLLPIFTTMCGGEGNYVYASQELVLHDSYFARKSTGEMCNHTTVMSKLREDTKLLQGMQPRAFAETFMQLLHKYASHVPAGVCGLDDVSLYDYVRTVAAIAVSLYECNKQGCGEHFLLVGADFSGIQQYIYDIVSKRAAKNLKGRSFYLRLTSDSIVRFLLRELGLYATNVIYNSGGCFYILAPDTTQLRTAIEGAVAQVEKAVFNEFGTSLYVAIDYVEMTADTLMNSATDDNLPSAWKRLFLKRDKKKSRRYSSMIKQNYTTFFDTAKSVEYSRDAITGEVFMPQETAELYSDDEEQIVVRSTTQHQIKLGEFLRYANRFIVAYTALQSTNTKEILHLEPLKLGVHYHFIKSTDSLNELASQLHAAGGDATIVTLNGENGSCTLSGLAAGCNNICAFEFYGGNDCSGMPAKTYEQLCACTGDLKRLGVLRMDVDNLGTIFQTGINDRPSLARYATLSRSFDYFFSGYLNTIWDCPEYRNCTQIIYSGGDDLFIVGRWDKTIELAQEIRKKFKEYTCYNESFSLSGGVAIVEPKFPIMVAAEESAQEESNAKEHTCKQKPKDAISFLGTALNWGSEYPVVKLLKDTLCEMLEENGKNPKRGLPKAFIGKLLMHHSNAEIKNHIIGNIKIYWLVSYDIQRMIERKKDNPDKSGNDGNANSLLENCKKEICSAACTTLNNKPIETDYHALELWALASRWAELEYRTRIINKQNK